MSIHIHTYTAESLPGFVAADMAGLTNVGSQYAKWLLAAAANRRAENTPEDIVWAVATRDHEFEIETLGWVAVYCDPATGHPVLGGFVGPQHRRKHLATVLSAVVLMAAEAPRNAIGVRGLGFLKIASHLGYKCIGLYTPVDDGFVVNWTHNTAAPDNDQE